MQNEREHTTPDKRRNAQKRRSKGRRIAIQAVATLLIALACNLLISMFLDTPKSAFIIRDGLRIDRQYEILQEKISIAENLLSEIRHRDHFVYRPLLGVDTLNIPQIYSDYPDSKYSDINQNIVKETHRKMDRLMRNIYYASLSLDDTQELAEHKEEFSTVIPAIWPIDRTKLKNLAGTSKKNRHSSTEECRLFIYDINIIGS